MASEQDMILFRVEDSVGIITLNRPEKLNAVSWELAEELSQLLISLRFNDEVRTILIHGAGRAFCAGGDVDFISGDSDRPMPGTSDPSRPIPRSQRKTPGGPFFEVARQLIYVDKPVIAAIHGPAVGAGLAYSLACDRRFGDTTTKMAAIFTNIGVAPDCGMSYFLPRIVGLPNALMMVETAQIFEAERCKELGLLDELVEEGKAYDAALDYAKSLAGRASVAIDMSRRMIHMSAQGATLEDILDYEGIAGVIVASTNDAREGTAAFMEKRKPEYKGN
ncbi:enoyl-CoA hydratase/isomerase family protein [Pseudohalioglobus lutimaris]|uniref:Enoyl-CoA hydratase/isomerase family protein n=1 Tax=Pseudohalioglobus lutimaris TaxID=1737061 RepID=A0A2N5X3Y1_9GAMM|nr:enoyl-CoA hydratase/isomerase family protein [Pseudohalioglobus lutimaris]PLW69201.1 enoyl-CoA hydratase/isomerase family protein [Pseudohalioglobus lutimaris]